MRPAPFRLCLYECPTHWASSAAWRSPAVTSLGSAILSHRWLESGSNFSRRSHPLSRVSPSCSIQRRPQPRIGFLAFRRGCCAIVRGSDERQPLVVHRELTIELTARHRVPTIYQYRYFVTSGGLISYGTDALDQYTRAAQYIDRILKGAKLSDLPVQT